jgi:hypothetical protein
MILQKLISLMSAYPNPTVDVPSCGGGDKWAGFVPSDFDSNGRTLSKLQEITAAETLLPQEKSHGIYFVAISNANKPQKL